MSDFILSMTIIKELKKNFNLNHEKAKVISTVFENNKGYIELAVELKYRLRTKHISLKYYFFQTI